MCGIVGICSQNHRQNAETVITMRETLRHRGPDDSGLWVAADGATILGHRRLSVIDLSPASHQPMQDAKALITISFNGEIYNYLELRDKLTSLGHSFRTQGDTEVIIEAYRHWGEDCVDHLNGMFAFALYDAVRDVLFAARDRAGEKPFYYWHNGKAIVFASELKALMRHPDLPRRLDLEAMNYYLSYGYVPWDACILQGVKKLPQGHFLIFDRRLNRLLIRRYWSLPEPESFAQLDEEDLVSEFKDLLTDAVRSQLVADVPLGILLSGGVDSSLITAIASEVSTKPVKTFTISFPGHARLNEEPYARIVANHFATEHTVLPAEAASVNLLPELAAQYDEPFADSSLIPTFLVSRLIRQHATVAIGGDGGDELFGGYIHYTWLQRQEMIRRYIPSFARSALASCVERFIPPGFRGRSYLMGLRGTVQDSFAFVNQFFDSRNRPLIFPPLRGLPHNSILRSERYKGQLKLPGKSVIEKGTAADFVTYLPDDILVKVDRASMLSSLEVRAPFLDYRIIEFAFARVPDRLRIQGKERKILPRMLAARLLPSNLDLKRKQGFSIPLANWLRGEWGDYMKSVLQAPDSCFDVAMVRRLFRTHAVGLANSQRLFALMMFELWRKYYRVTIN